MVSRENLYNFLSRKVPQKIDEGKFLNNGKENMFFLVDRFIIACGLLWRKRLKVLKGFANNGSLIPPTHANEILRD